MSQHLNFINGCWLSGGSEIENINPSDTSDVIGHYALATNTQVESAFKAANKAQYSWSKTSPQKRFEILEKIANEINERLEEIASLLAREEGKAIVDARIEVFRAVQIFKFFAGEALRLSGEILSSTREGFNVEISREPVGVVSVITPWNFPIAIPAWKIAPALAYGNAVVFKPSELVPGCAWVLAEIISRSGLPDGVFNLVLGDAAEIGNTLVQDEHVKAVSFTGSVATGRKIALASVTRPSSMVKFQLEMGGKNALIVLEDADLDLAVANAINGAFYSTGQRCTASSRLIVSEKIHDKFVEMMVKEMQKIVVGDARDESVIIGPVSNKRQLEQDLEYIKLGKNEGATIVYGGSAIPELNNQQGYYLEPTLFTGATPDMRICQEEIFGPIAAVIKFTTPEEALEIANNTLFGLSAGVCTRSLKWASYFKSHLKSGMVMVNGPTASVDHHVPFGGTKASSYGAREQGKYAAEFYTTIKTSYINA